MTRWNATGKEYFRAMSPRAGGLATPRSRTRAQAARPAVGSFCRISKSRSVAAFLARMVFRYVSSFPTAWLDFFTFFSRSAFSSSSCF
jgi:hypothetical protein